VKARTRKTAKTTPGRKCAIERIVERVSLSHDDKVSACLRGYLRGRQFVNSKPGDPDALPLPAAAPRLVR
jgi:hypothetical protein